MMNNFKSTRIYSWVKRTLSTRRIVHFFRLHYYKLFKRGRTFQCDGKKYRYFYHAYNTAWRTERTVEIPVIWDIVQQYRDRRILEVGNVLSHYYPVSHDILDKYEKAPGVVNKDVIDYQPGKKYDLIVTISTLEHVGWDEETKDPNKILVALERLKSLLADGGMIAVTVPLGYNSAMDDLLFRKSIRFDRQYALKRVSAANDWTEVEMQDLKGTGFNHPFKAANGLVIGFIER